MLSLPLLAARARLLRAPAASRCASIAARSLSDNVSILCTQLNHLNLSKSRAFSSIDGPKDEDEGKDEKLALEDANEDEQEPNDDDLSPLECLMQHSQQFRVEMDLDEDDSEQAGDTENEPFADEWQEESSPKIKSTSRSSGAFKRNTFRRRGNSDRHVELGRRAEGHLIGKDTDDIDYDAELENVWDEEQLKQRKFHQALRREQDRDHVCTNCGERGHRARNCLIPRICSNCGNLGHTAHQCRYKRNPDSIEEFVIEGEELKQKKKENKKLRQKVAKYANAKNRDVPRPKDMPTTDLSKRNERLRKEMDAELDAYADMLERMDRKRQEQKTNDETSEH